MLIRLCRREMGNMRVVQQRRAASVKRAELPRCRTGLFQTVFLSSSMYSRCARIQIHEECDLENPRPRLSTLLEYPKKDGLITRKERVFNFEPITRLCLMSTCIICFDYKIWRSTFGSAYGLWGICTHSTSEP